MHVGVTDARESQDARASRCSDTERNTRVLERTVSFRDKNLLTLPSLSRASIPRRLWKNIIDGGWTRTGRSIARSKRPLQLVSREALIRRDVRMQMVDAGNRSSLAKNSPWPWATLSTYYDTSKPRCGAFLGFDVRSVRVAAAPASTPRATNCNPCKHDLRCSPAD